jgi:hypothetical protein
MPVRVARTEAMSPPHRAAPRRLSLTLGIAAHDKTILVSGQIPLAVFRAGATFDPAMDSFSFV